jgi:hypothetical protein
MRLEATGIRMELPRGWEGRVRTRDEAVAGVARTAATGRPAPMTVSAANFALPQTLGDFGGGAVEAMTSRDLFLTLFEYGPESAGTALFAREGMPRRLRPDDLDPSTLRTPLPGMSGAQFFFTEAGRPLCLYVAVGSHLRRLRTLPVLTGILQTVQIDPA